MLNFVSALVPAQAANFLTVQRQTYIFTACAKAVQMVQARAKGKDLDESARKKQAYEIAKDDWDLNNHVLGYSKEVDKFVLQNFLPAMISGCVKTYNLAGWFETSQPINYGGNNNPVQPEAVSTVPSPAPKVVPISNTGNE